MRSDESNPPPKLEEATVGILTALEEEYAACRHVFDPEELGIEEDRRATSGRLTCWVCRITSKQGNSHVVAITQLLQAGNTASAIAANILLQHCQGMRHIVMCGIAGAVPSPANPDGHVRLGDIVVCNVNGVIHYCRGKQRSGTASPAAAGIADPFAGFEIRSPPRPPCAELLAAIARMHADECTLKRSQSRRWETLIADFLTKRDRTWKKPGRKFDRLDDSPDGKSAFTPHPKDPERRRGRPRVFRAPIGAADIVLADPVRRNSLRDRHGVKAVEMEGSGIADASWVANVGYLVVRGTCDYCNSCKNDIWHKYAALIAAAYTRCVLEYLHPLSTTRALPLPLPVPKLSDKRRGRFRGIAPTDHPHRLVEVQAGGPSRSSPENLSGESAAPDSEHVQPVIQPSAILPTAQGREIAARIAGNEFIRTSIKALTDRGTLLQREGHTTELDAVKAELEKQLKKAPRKGSEIRDGWLLLAKVEVQKMLERKAAGDTIDLKRLTALRQEADSVID